MGLHWESLDYCLSKDIVEEGPDPDADWPRTGAEGTVAVDNLETINFTPDMSEILTSNRFHIGFSTTEFDRSLEKILRLMCPGELASVKVRLVFDSGCSDSLVECQLRLETLVNADPVYNWPPETKIERAHQLYTKGADLCRIGRHADAFPLLRDAMTLLAYVQEGEAYDATTAKSAMEGQRKPLPPSAGLLKDKSDLETAKALRAKCLSNMTLCRMKSEDYQSVVDMTSTDDVKALYRVGTAHAELGNHLQAVGCLEKALEAEPSNKAVAAKLKEVKARRTKAEQGLQKGLKKMFL